MNRKVLQEFISIDDLPKLDYYSDINYLRLYQKILIKGGDRQLMAKHTGRKPMSVKKKLKSIIKRYNLNNWSCFDVDCSYIKDIESLEARLLDGTFSNPF